MIDNDLTIINPKWGSCDRAVIVGKDFDGVIEVQYPKYCKGLAFIWNFWIEPPFRKKGHGKQLFNAALDHAISKGCHTAELEWSPKESAKWTYNWYMKQGFRLSQKLYGVSTLSKILPQPTAQP